MLSNKPKPESIVAGLRVGRDQNRLEVSTRRTTRALCRVPRVLDRQVTGAGDAGRQTR